MKPGITQIESWIEPVSMPRWMARGLVIGCAMLLGAVLGVGGMYWMHEGRITAVERAVERFEERTQKTNTLLEKILGQLMQGKQP